MEEKIIRINTKSRRSLERGAKQIAEALDDLNSYLNQKVERECVTCHDIEFMNPGETVCWRCERIAQGLGVCKPKPNGEDGYLRWNFHQKEWQEEPLAKDQDLPQWGKH